MKQFILILVSVLLLDIVFQQCANPVSPTGGPKDTLAPNFIRSNPSIGAINFTDQILTLEFDEYINADKIQQNLIITPKSSIKYKHTIKKNKLVISFEAPFADSTTYSLNFFNGITDITEKNPAENLTLAFSTGSYIDSMVVSGSVTNLFTQKSSKDFTVGLYPINDTLSYLTDNPTYFTTTDGEGKFYLQYIKSGKYKIISFMDENKNLLLDPETEGHGFLSDTIKLFITDSIQYTIRTQLINIKPIQFINARPIAQYIELKYNREIDTYSISPDSTYSTIIGEKKDAIRIFKPSSYNYNDSVRFIITSLDSLSNSTTDTITSVFLESRRALPKFNSSFVSQANKELANNQRIKVKFSKPIISLDTSKLSFIKDSTFSYSIHPILNWNHNKTELEILTNINIDSLLSSLIKTLPIDTTVLDSTQNQFSSQSSLPLKSLVTSSNYTLEFAIEKGAFISIENDTIKRKTLAYKTNEKKPYGTVNIELSTSYEKYTLQLLSSNDQVKYQMSNEQMISFSKVTPGTYSIRILIDSNKDGQWSYGNILKNIEPEPVYIYPEETTVRENWVLDLEISFE